MQESCDVVVVGAGASGLAAAAQLSSQGHEVVVLEARDRIGGRLLSVPTGNGVGLDIGATWFWANEPRINQLIADSGLETFTQHLDGDAMFENDQGVQRMDGNQVDAPSGRLVAGMQAVTDALAAKLPVDTIRLSTPVRRITKQPDALAVEMSPSGDGSSGTVIAQHVIVAVPPATAVAAIDFDGALASRVHSLAASTPVWMGATTKVVAIYDTAFWRDQGLAGAAFSYPGPLREIHDMSGPDGSPAALFGFAQPGAGQPAPTNDHLLAQLSALFGPKAGEPIELIVHDWRADEYTSPSNVDDLTLYQTFGHPLFAEPAVDGRLHWCSTETATVAPGHIAGALQAAERTASAVGTALKQR